MGKLTPDRWNRHRHDQHHAPRGRVRTCGICDRAAGALYTVWLTPGDYEDRIALCGLCLDKHNRGSTAVERAL